MGKVIMSGIVPKMATSSLSPAAFANAAYSKSIETVHEGKAPSVRVVSDNSAKGHCLFMRKGEVHTAPTTVSIYGVEWDGTETTRWTRTDKSANFADPNPYVLGASSYGSPFDNLYPWSGMVKEEDPIAGTLVKIPKFYFKWTASGAKLKLQIADGPVKGFYTSPAHADRGDGKGERDYIYVGRYHCGPNYKSQTGVEPKSMITRSTARSGIHSLGTNLWQFDAQALYTIRMLYLVEFSDWNSQETIGYGCGNGSNPGTSGYTDSMPYHTGTTFSSRKTYGLGTQYRNIEGLWSGLEDWVDGCYNNDSGFHIINTPSKFSDTANGTLAGGITFGNGWPSAFAVSNTNGLEWVFYPTAGIGNGSNYMSDVWDPGQHGPCPAAGGTYSKYQNYGIFFMYFYSASAYGDNAGCRLQKLP